MNAKKTWKLYLLEDDAKRGKQVEAALKAALSKRFHVERLDTGAPGDKRAYEDRLLSSLEGQQIALIVTDRDLSTMKNYPGLSEAPVSRVAAQLYVPLCVYASGKSDTFLERHRTGGGGRIILDPSDYDAMAHQVGVLAKGFIELRELVESIASTKKARSKYRGPASVLATMLHASDVVDHLALYTRGDQRMLDGLLEETSGRASKGKASKGRTSTGKGSRARSETTARVALALGVWLYDSVLRFPGIILDLVAASSFLNIDQKQLVSPPIQKVFAGAEYKGPFADNTEPRWWRHRLADIIFKAEVADGRALIKKLTDKAPDPCRCSVDKKAPAGFVCVMTNAPVCEAHSVAEIGWLPRGADLARIRRDRFEEIGPWIGML